MDMRSFLSSGRGYAVRVQCGWTGSPVPHFFWIEHLSCYSRAAGFGGGRFSLENWRKECGGGKPGVDEKLKMNLTAGSRALTIEDLVPNITRTGACDAGHTLRPNLRERGGPS
jgi:hypothetical protein